MISLAIPLSKHHFFQTDNQKAMLFTVFSLFELFHSQIFKFSNFVAKSKAHIWLAICEFLWLLTNQNFWFVTFFALNYLKTAFIITNQNWVIFPCKLLLWKQGKNVRKVQSDICTCSLSSIIMGEIIMGEEIIFKYT